MASSDSAAQSSEVGSDAAGTSNSTAAMDAKARREARKARILGSGQDRLARITKTGRGGEAEALYAEHKPLGGAQRGGGVVDVDEDEVLRRANKAMRGGTGDGDDDDPQDVDISQTPNQAMDPFAAMMAQRQQQVGMAPEQQAQMPDDLQGFMRAMQQAMGAGGVGAGAGAADPNAAGGMPPFPFGNMAGATAQMPAEPAPPSLLDAVFNILRILVILVFGLALTYGVLTSGHAEASRSVAESAGADVVQTFDQMSTLNRWARLAYERPAHWEARYFGIQSFGLPGGVQDIPVFWLLITLEIGFSSMRIMLQRRRPQPPGFLLKVASFIPIANVQLLLRTLAAYLPLLDAFINDLAIVVFTIGCAVMFAAWKVGLDPLQVVSDGTSLFDKAAASVPADVVGQIGEMAGSLHAPLM